MRKFLLATAVVTSAATTAFAADIPVKAPVAPAAFNWTGCYFGAVGGENWGRSSQVARSGARSGLPITGDFDLSGAIAGGTVGCNIEVDNFVYGAEADLSSTNTKGSAFDQPPFIATTTSATREKWADTLRGRFGYAIDQFMVYGTAGVTTARVGVDISNPAFVTVSDIQNRSGWTAGAGGEWAVWTAPWGALTLKLEYLHADYGTGQFVNPPVLTTAGSTVATRDVKLTNDMVRVGMNVLFNLGGTAPAAKQ